MPAAKDRGDPRPVDGALALARREGAALRPSPALLQNLYAIPAREKQRLAFGIPEWLMAWPRLSSLAATALLAGYIAGVSGLLAPGGGVEVEMGAALYGSRAIMEAQ